LTLPQLKPPNPNPAACVMRCELSLLPAGHFVQMRSAFQIKFTSSVAGALHQPDPKLEQGDPPTAQFPLTATDGASFNRQQI
jgi:hypothetical protein